MKTDGTRSGSRPMRNSLAPGYWLVTALSLSIGWGIRGNFGHEFGAMIAGALAAMALVLFSGREDWYRRIHYFALFGAIGWSFGGSQSYMQVLAYTHSGDSVSVLYGFACLFVIGFLWAAFGGAGTALPAVLDRERLTGLFAPMTVVFVAWIAEDLWLEPWLESRGNTLNWFDTDWLGALVAVVAALGWAATRRRVDDGTSLILHMALGWWAGFLRPGRRPRLPDDAAEGRQLGGLPRHVRGADGLLLAGRLARRGPRGARHRHPRRDRLRLGRDAQAGRGHVRTHDQLAQHLRADGRPLQRPGAGRGDGDRRAENACSPGRSARAALDRRLCRGVRPAGHHLPQPPQESRNLDQGRRDGARAHTACRRRRGSTSPTRRLPLRSWRR